MTKTIWSLRQRLATWLEKLAMRIGGEEKRCLTCRERTNCPAFGTGVCYPCPYYEERPTQ